MVLYLISAAKRKHLQSKILNSTSSKNLYSTMNDLLGTSADSPLPTAYNQNELPSVFSAYFHNKIQALQDTLETLPSTLTPSWLSIHWHSSLIFPPCLSRRSPENHNVHVSQNLWTRPPSCLSLLWGSFPTPSLHHRHHQHFHTDWLSPWQF